MLLYCVHKSGIGYVVDDFICDGTAEETVRTIKQREMGKKPYMRIIDPLSKSADMITRKTLFAELYRLGLDDTAFKIASKDIHGGIIRMRDAFASGKLFICDSATITTIQLENWIWNEKKKHLEFTTGKSQTPIKNDDDMPENLYRILLLDAKWVNPNNYISDGDMVYNHYATA